MSDRNWEQELAKIDKQLASVSDEQLLSQNAPPRGPVTAPASSGKAALAGAKAVPVTTVVARQPKSWIAWVQLTVAVAAASGLWFWPWATRCGLNAISFTAATGAVTLLGVWSAVGSWRHRQGAAHVLSFAVIIWGLVLGAREVLPRVGYAIPSIQRPSGWSCEALPAMPATPPVPVAPTLPSVPTVPAPAIPPPVTPSGEMPALNPPSAGR